MNYHEMKTVIKNKDSILEYDNKKNLIKQILEAVSHYNMGLNIKNNKIYLSLIEALEFDIMNAKSEKFPDLLDITMSERVIFEDKADFWPEMLLLIRNYYVNLLTNKKEITRLELIMQKAQVVVFQRLFLITANHSTKMDILFFELRNILQVLNSAISREKLIDIISESFPLIGIKECFILLYENEITDKKVGIMPEFARLVLSIKENIIITKNTDNPLMPTRKILTDNMNLSRKRNTWIVMPLLDKDVDFGLIVFGLNRKEAIIYETLRAQISNSLLKAKLFHERQMAEDKLRIALSELEKSNIELHSLSLKDELTGLYNRRGVSILGEQHYQIAKRNGGRFLLIFADMDGLKLINDMYGHSEGDFALITAAEILKKNFRQSDIIGRIGGDEFTIIAADSVKNDVKFIKTRINEMLGAINNNLRKPFKVSLSFGFAVFDPQNNTKSFSEMIAEADKMLYREKRKKKG